MKVIDWTLFLKMFNLELWIASVIILLLLGLFTYLSIQEFWCSIGLSLFRISEIICRQGMSDVPVKIYAKIIFVIMLMISFVLNSAYTANLISFLAAKKIFIPFHDIPSLFYDTDFEVGAIYGTNIHDYFAEVFIF